jgi:hypothetical protein
MLIVQEGEKLVARVANFHWEVATSWFDYNRYLDDGDSLQVEADTMTKAKGAAVSAGIMTGDDNPFDGMKVYSMVCSHGVCNCFKCRKKCEACKLETEAAMIVDHMRDPELQAQHDLFWYPHKYAPGGVHCLESGTPKSSTPSGGSGNASG